MNLYKFGKPTRVIIDLNVLDEVDQSEELLELLEHFIIATDMATINGLHTDGLTPMEIN